MALGTIVKALSGYYYVSVDGNVWQCRGRGILRKKEVTPLVGDIVDISYTENGEGTVDNIHERRNELIRPPIANVDFANLVFSMSRPAFNQNLLDKFLVHTEKAGLDSLICLTKTDLVSEDESDQTFTTKKVKDIYEPLGYKVIETSAKQGKGIPELLEHLGKHTSVFAGQSGVGKSSLLNAMIPSLGLETAEISMKLGRGKHTTRHVELISLPTGGYVADTPGFSQLDFTGIEPTSLSSYFREMDERSVDCKFRSCAHVNEPGCAVREAVQSGGIDKGRYDNYLLFYEEIKEQSRRQYK